MPTTIIDPNNVSAAERSIPKDTPVLMLNLLRWKQQADYSGHPDAAPCTGQEAYLQRYVPAFHAIAAGIQGIRPFWLGAAVAGLVGPIEEHWDVVALVRYPNFAAFRTVTESPEYKANAQHRRLVALEDWRLIATVETALI
jgi:uncharacterized protein (DUF1330 family)